MSDRVFELRELDLPADAPDWHETNEIRGYAVIAFARAPVLIRHEGGRPLVADRSCAMLYNPCQRYRRGLLDERGDNCLYVALPTAIACEAFGAHDPSVSEHPEAPVRVPRAPADAPLALSLARWRRAERSGDRLAADVEGARLVDRVAHAAAEAARAPVTGSGRRASTRDAHEDLVERTRAEIARTCLENRGLAEIARAVHASAFHLARLFREHTGASICTYRNQLRLRAAALLVVETTDPITRIAHRTGFATHAHMTTAFRRVFGVTPSALRRGEPARA